MIMSEKSSPGLTVGWLKKVHHIALNVKNMEQSKHFYGNILGLHQLTGTEIPSTLIELVAAGKVCNFQTPDGTILDLFAEPDLSPPDSDPEKQFTRANHLAFDIEPQLFDKAIAVLKQRQIPVAIDVVTRLTGRGFYIYDPDGFIIEIRCDPLE